MYNAISQGGADSASVESSTCSVVDVPLVVEPISTPSPQPLPSSPQPLLLLEDGASESSVCVSESVVSSDELKVLSELLPEAPEDSVHGSEDSVHSWEVVRNESRLVVRHNIVFSDSELSVGDSPMVLSNPGSPVSGSSVVNSPVGVKDVASVVSAVSEMESLVLPVKPSMELSGESSVELSSESSVRQSSPSRQSSPVRQSPVKPSPVRQSSPQSPQSPQSPINQPTPLPTPLLFTPPRSHKRSNPVIQQVTNDSPTCSPSKRISTAVSVPHTLETPKRPQRITKTSVESPTKVVEETPAPPVEETKRPLSTRVRRLLTLQEEERNRFQRVMRHQTNGLYEAFQREREDGKVRRWNEMRRRNRSWRSRRRTWIDT